MTKNDNTFEPGDRVFCTVCREHATVVDLEEFNAERGTNDVVRNIGEYVYFKTDNKWHGQFYWRTSRERVNLIEKDVKTEIDGQLLMF